MKIRSNDDHSRNARLARTILTLGKGRFILMLGVIALTIGLGGIVYAQSQSQSSWDECSDNDSKFSLGYCVWQKSNIAQNQSAYVEGAAVPVRFIATQITKTQIIGGQYVDVYTWQTDWGTTQNHGFDWMVTWDQASRLHQDYIGAALTLNRCGDLINDKPSQDACNLVTSSTAGRLITVTAPGDSYLSGLCGPNIVTCSTQDRITAFEQIYGPRYLEFYLPATTATNTPSLQLWHTLGSGTDYLTSSYVGYTLTITSTAQITQSMIAFASHLALSGNPYVNPMAWGEYPVSGGGVGAAPIPGASWHHLKRYVNGDGSATEMQVVLAVDSSSAPILSSRSTGLITTSGAQVRDTITMTHDSQDPQIFGSVRFYVCRWDSKPSTDPAVFPGCTTGGTQLTPDVTLNVITASNMSTVTSPAYTPVQTGYYCFRAAFTPSGTPPLHYAPLSDTNPYSVTTVISYPNPSNRNQTVNTSVTPECFQVQKTTAVELSSFAARVGDGLEFGGFPLIGLVVGLLGIVASAGVGVIAWKGRKSDQQ